MLGTKLNIFINRCKFLTIFVPTFRFIPLMHAVLRIKLLRLCEKSPLISQLGHPVALIPLNASGSGRRYYRLDFGTNSVVACVSPNTKENKTFLTLSDFLLRHGLNVPRIITAAKSNDIYILEDLGDTDLLSIIESYHKNIFSDFGQKDFNSVFSSSIFKLLKNVVKSLVKFQRLPQIEWENKVEFEPLNSTLIWNDLAYAVHNLFLPSGVDFNEQRLNVEFEWLEHKLLSCPDMLWGLMYRDFQSRNIMVVQEKPYFIDYQSCRRGPGIYDLVSFAWQAKACFSSQEREALINMYCEEFASQSGIAELNEIIVKEIPYWVCFRIMQTLGAYGLRGLKERKQHFIDSIPSAINNLIELMDHNGLYSEMPELRKTICSLSLLKWK